MKKGKRILSVLLVAVMLLTAVPFSASAATVGGSCGDDVTWSLDTGTGLMIYDGTGQMGFYSQWQYGPYLQSYRYTIQNAIINKGITNVGTNCFCLCENLLSVSIPDSVTAIDFYAFNNCYKITEVNTVNTSYIGNHAFYNCYVLSTIKLSKSLTKIDAYAFGNCYSLNNIYYEGSIEDWNQITIDSRGNQALNNATIYYNCEADNSTFTPNWLSQDSKEYNHNLARFCAESSLKCYPNKGMEEFLRNNGFTSSGYSDPGNTNRDELAYYIASRKDTIGGKEYNTVLVSFVGTTPCEQWSSNFDPYFRYRNGDLLPSTNHAGFQMAMGCVYSGLEKFLEEMKKNNDLTKENTKFILTGHSRGAAASNLMAAMMIDEEKYATKENIFTYTFATPNNTKDTSVSADKYLRIFNIVNPCDFVTHVMPTAWEYGKYGTVISLPEPYVTDYNQKVIVEYKKLTGRDYFAYYENGQKEVVDFVNKLTQKVSNVSDFYGKKFKIGDFTKETVFNFFQDTLCKIAAESNDKTPATLKLVSVLKEPFCDSVFTSISSFFVTNSVAFEPLDFDTRFNDNHSMELYCAFVKGLTSDEIQHKRTYTIGKYNCPVDVEVIEAKSGEVVGRIVNNVVDVEIAEKENAVVMTVEGDEKECWLPSDGNYKIILTGNDTGTMDHVLSIYDPVEGEIARTCFNQVELERGLTMESFVNGEDFEIEEYSLNYEDGSTRVADVVMQNEEIETKEITVITEGEGYVGENYTVTKGDYLTLEAVTLGSECNKFEGYYADDKLLSEEASYRFRVDDSMTITAKFAKSHTDADNDSKCDTCGEDLGTHNPSDNCSHMCHQDGFMGFIWKILNLFNRIFGINKTCSCGVNHY